MSVQRISEIVEDRVRTAVELEAVDGEEIVWDSTILPGANQSPAAYVTVGLAGAVLGSLLQVGLFIQNPSLLGAEEAAELVHQGLEALRQQRTAQLLERPTNISNPELSLHGGVLLG